MPFITPVVREARRVRASIWRRLATGAARLPGSGALWQAAQARTYTACPGWTSAARAGVASEARTAAASAQRRWMMDAVMVFPLGPVLNAAKLERAE